MVDDNDALVGELNEGFNYLGTNYGRSGRLGFMKAAILDYKLIPRMKQLADFQKQMGNEKQLITQMIYKLITPCQSRQDLRDALPECLVQLLSDMYKTLPTRKRDPAWCLTTERDIRQYRKILPKIETYSAMRFLY